MAKEKIEMQKEKTKSPENKMGEEREKERV